MLYVKQLHEKRERRAVATLGRQLHVVSFSNHSQWSVGGYFNTANRAPQCAGSHNFTPTLSVLFLISFKRLGGPNRDTILLVWFVVVDGTSLAPYGAKDRNAIN